MPFLKSVKLFKIDYGYTYVTSKLTFFIYVGNINYHFRFP